MNIVICEADIEMAESIAYSIKKYISNVTSLKIFSHADKLLNYLLETFYYEPNIILMNASLRIQNNIKYDIVIKEKFPYVKIIYMADDYQGIEGIFEAEPSYLLMRPIAIDKMTAAFQTVYQQFLKTQSNIIPIKTKGLIVRVDTGKIHYIESRNRVLTIYEGEDIINVYLKMEEIEGELPKTFLRCHKSYIVNLDRVKYLQNSTLILYNKQVIPISRPYFKEMKEKFLNYLKEKE